VTKTKDLESLPSFSFGPTQLEEEEMNGFCELYSKTILLSKWFLCFVLQNHFAVGMVSNKNNMNNIFQQFIFWAFTTNPSNIFPANNHGIKISSNNLFLLISRTTLSPFCCRNGFYVLYSKTILLWEWFPARTTWTIFFSNSFFELLLQIHQTFFQQTIMG